MDLAHLLGVPVLPSRHFIVRPQGGLSFPRLGPFPLAVKSTEVIDRLAQPLHCKFDVLRLQMAPALDLGLVALLWEIPEISLGQLPGGRALPGEFLVNERVSGHGAIEARQRRAGNRPMARSKKMAPARWDTLRPVGYTFQRQRLAVRQPAGCRDPCLATR